MSYAKLMKGETYTLKQVAELLSPDGDEEARSRIARQVRHWTTLDLLTPVGRKHTGTGVSRRYAADEVRKAAILLELNQYHLPVTALSEADWSENFPLSAEWQVAIKGKRPVFLQLALSHDLLSLQIYEDQPRHNILIPRPDVKRNADRDKMLPVSAIVINLSRLFARLRL